MARYIIIIALSIITLNPGTLIYINAQHTSDRYSILDKQEPRFIQSDILNAVSNFHNVFFNRFQMKNISDDRSQDQKTCVIKLKKQARVIRSS